MTHYLSALTVFSLLLAPGQEAPAQRDSLSLFTATEAEELRIEEDDWDPVPRARGAALGPVIVVRAPEIQHVEGSGTIEASSPTSFHILFEENEAPVDMGSLDVKAKKGIFTKSLTEKLTPFVRGTTIAVDSIEVPRGKFQIQITIRDAKGQETIETYRLIIEG